MNSNVAAQVLILTSWCLCLAGQSQVYTEELRSSVEEVRLQGHSPEKSACLLVDEGYFIGLELEKGQEAMKMLKSWQKEEWFELSSLQLAIDNLLQSNWLKDDLFRNKLLKEEQAKSSKSTTKTVWNSETQEMEVKTSRSNYNPPSLLGAYRSSYGSLFLKYPEMASQWADRMLVECRSSPQEVLTFLTSQYSEERRTYETDWKGWEEVQKFYGQLASIVEVETWETDLCGSSNRNETRANPGVFKPHE